MNRKLNRSITKIIELNRNAQLKNIIFSPERACMMEKEYHIRIKKEYAASLIEHLRKENAIELIEQNDPEIPEWQKMATKYNLLQREI